MGKFGSPFVMPFRSVWMNRHKQQNAQSKSLNFNLYLRMNQFKTNIRAAEAVALAPALFRTQSDLKLWKRYVCCWCVWRTATERANCTFHFSFSVCVGLDFPHSNTHTVSPFSHSPSLSLSLFVCHSHFKRKKFCVAACDSRKNRKLSVSLRSYFRFW